MKHAQGTDIDMYVCINTFLPSLYPLKLIFQQVKDRYFKCNKYINSVFLPQTICDTKCSLAWPTLFCVFFYEQWTGCQALGGNSAGMSD